MVKDMKEVWVYAETRNGNVMPVFGELVSKARELTADVEGCKVCGVLLGTDADAVEKVKTFGVD